MFLGSSYKLTPILTVLKLVLFMFAHARPKQLVNNCCLFYNDFQMCPNPLVVAGCVCGYAVKKMCISKNDEIWMKQRGVRVCCREQSEVGRW